MLFRTFSQSTSFAHSEWTHFIPQDFLDIQMMNALKIVNQRIMDVYPALFIDMHNVMNVLNQKVSQLLNVIVDFCTTCDTSVLYTYIYFQQVLRCLIGCCISPMS